MLAKLLTVKQIAAERLQCKPDAVLAFIATKELLAMNIAPKGSKRPTWRITEEALADFERRRTTLAPVKPPTRRKAAERAVTKFF